MSRLIRLAALGLMALALVPAPSAMAADGATLLKQNGCLACHATTSTEAKRLGPNFAAVAKKYAKNPKAKALVMDKIAKGGKGAWGAMPMPPQPKLSKATLGAMADAVLKAK